jgi:hypothetical protein
MATKAASTQGTQIQVKVGTATTYTTIAEVYDFTIGGGNVGEIDATHFQSSAKEKLKGLADSGQLTFKCNFVQKDADGAQKQCKLDAQNSLAPNRDFKIIFQGEVTPVSITFSGYVKAFPISGSKEDIYRADVTVEISGTMVWAGD